MHKGRREARAVACAKINYGGRSECEKKRRSQGIARCITPAGSSPWHYFESLLRPRVFIAVPANSISIKEERIVVRSRAKKGSNNTEIQKFLKKVSFSSILSFGLISNECTLDETLITVLFLSFDGSVISFPVLYVLLYEI